MKKINMNRRLIGIFILIATTLPVAAQTAKTTPPAWTRQVGARVAPASTRILYVNDQGARPDSNVNSTRAIQQTIDQCAKAGGGVVAFKPGHYMSGALFLRDNVELRLDAGVTLLGSQDFADYPDTSTRIAGIEMVWPSALINAINVKKAAITGKGLIDARGKFCWDKYWTMRKDYDKKGLRWIVDYDAKRVRTLVIQSSEDVTVRDLTFRNAGFWTVQVLYSKHVTVAGVVIRNNEGGTGPSTDGVDIDSSSWCLVEDCDIDCNDDNFCLKAGRDWDGLRVNRPTEYVVIRRSIARRGAGLVTLGSETSGGIRHIYCSDLTAKHTDNGLRIKSGITRGGVIDDIHFVDSKLDSVNNAYQFNLNWYPAYSYSTLPAGYSMETVPTHWKTMLQKVEPASKGIPKVGGITIRNVSITNAKKAFEIAGLDRSVIADCNFINSRITAETLGTMEFTARWNFVNTSIDVSQKKVEKKTTGGLADQERLHQ
jgi:polygalacturonase